MTVRQPLTEQKRGGRLGEPSAGIGDNDFSFSIRGFLAGGGESRTGDTSVGLEIVGGRVNAPASSLLVDGLLRKRRGSMVLAQFWCCGSGSGGGAGSRWNAGGYDDAGPSDRPCYTTP